MRNTGKPVLPDYSGSDLPNVVKDALGDRNLPKEASLWAAMNPKQRERSVQRIEAITRWHGDRNGWTADDAARAADLSKPRFYTLSMKWEDAEARSLALLGVQAKAPRRRQRWKSEIVTAISDGAAKLVAEHDKEEVSVAKLAEELHDRLAHHFEKFPKASTLRSSIIEALRLAKIGDEVGTDIAFDACATNMLAVNDRAHVAFVAIDRGTGYILGASMGDIADSVSAYQNLARDIWLGFNDDQAFASVPWALRLERMEFVIGSDLIAFREWELNLKKAISMVNIQGSNKPRRFGRYLKEHVGMVIGRVRLLPAQTLRPTIGYDLPGQAVTRPDATAKLRLEVADHNRRVLELLPSTKTELPSQFSRVFEKLALST